MRVAEEEGAYVSKASLEGQVNFVLCMGLRMNFPSSSHVMDKMGQWLDELCLPETSFQMLGA